MPARHAAYFLATLRRRPRPQSTGLDERLWFDRLALEHDNLRAALTWLTGPTAEDGPDAAGWPRPSWPFWFARGFPTEGIGWLQAAVRRCPPRRTRAGQGQGAQRPGHPGRVPGELRPGLGLRPGVPGPVPGARRRRRHRRLADRPEHDRGVGSQRRRCSGDRHGRRGQGARAAAARPPGDRRTCSTSRECSPCRAATRPLAVTRWQEALALHRELEQPARRGLHLVRPRPAFRPAGRYRPGRPDWLVEGLRLGQHLDYKLIIQYCLIGLGQLAAAGGRLPPGGPALGRRRRHDRGLRAHLTRAARAILDYERAAGRRPAAAGRVDLGRGVGRGPADDHRPGRRVRAGRRAHRRRAVRAAPARTHRSGSGRAGSGRRRY